MGRSGLLMVSLKLLLSVMRISSRDNILTACRTEGYFQRGFSRAQRQGRNFQVPIGLPYPEPTKARWDPKVAHTDIQAKSFSAEFG